jgi:hypothetical protein
MNIRSVGSRLAKLEARQPRSGEYLLVWRGSREPASSAIGQQASRASKSICVDWTGEGAPPEPRWLRGGRYRGISDDEWDAIDRALRVLIARLPDPPAPDVRMKEQLMQMADNELLYRVFGVSVQ